MVYNLAMSAIGKYQVQAYKKRRKVVQNHQEPKQR